MAQRLMDWLWWLLGNWRKGGKCGVRRIIIVVIDGLDPSRVDGYLEEGLLHHLALLSDIGGRLPLVNPPTGSVSGSICDAVRKIGMRMVELLPVEPCQPADLAAICAADRDQQERLFAALARSRPPVVMCVFDMPMRIRQLFGPQPDAAQRLVLRDVYARMDEIVGKAFSFVDEKAVLLAVIRGQSCGDLAPTAAAAGLLFSSRKIGNSTCKGCDETELEAVISGLLRPPTREA